VDCEAPLHYAGAQYKQTFARTSQLIDPQNKPVVFGPTTTWVCRKELQTCIGSLSLIRKRCTAVGQS